MSRTTRSAKDAVETAPPPKPKSTTRKTPATTTTAVAARSRSVKRPASPEGPSRTPSPTPPNKRRRTAEKIEIDEKPVKKPRITKKPADNKVGKIVAKKVSAPKKTVKATEKKPVLNPIPSPPEHTRPAPVLFGWGAGNFGQFGMGEDCLGELEKPTRNKLVEEKMEDGVFGGEGAGLEFVAAGGMYSLFIDEQGTVGYIPCRSFQLTDIV